MSKLKHTLIVRHPDTDAATALVAGSEVPDWANGLVAEGDLVAADDAKSSAGASKPTKAEMQAEIARRNESRDEADRIVYASDKNDDLAAALAADDAKSSVGE